MTEQRVSARYALALLNTAKPENLVDSVFNDFVFVEKHIAASKDFLNLIKSPVINHWQKKNVFKEMFESHLNKLTFNFFMLLIDKRREGLIYDIIKQYNKLYNEENNLLEVSIISAIELNNEIKNNLNTKLAEITKKKIISNYSIDKSIKGGVQINIEGWVYDASVAGMLDKLHKSLIEGNK